MANDGGGRIPQVLQAKNTAILQQWMSSLQRSGGMREDLIPKAEVQQQCAEFLDLLASYTEGCRLLEEVEANPAKAHCAEEVQRRVVASGRQWRAAMLRIGRRPAHTVGGMMAKGAAMHGYITEYLPEDAEGVVLARSLLEDLQRRF